MEHRFKIYSDGWFNKLEVLFEDFVNACKKLNTIEREGLVSLISRMTAHIKEYYTIKWAMAQDRSFFFYFPAWNSPMENAYSWMSGFKPSMVFNLVEMMRLGRTKGPVLLDLTGKQVSEIEALRNHIRSEEMKVDREFERQQVALADRRMVELARLVTRFRGGVPHVNHVDALVDIATKNVLNGMELMMKSADCVRLKTLKGLLEILNPSQGVRFLTANANLQIKLRKWGIEKENTMAAQPDEASSSSSAPPPPTASTSAFATSASGSASASASTSSNRPM